MLRAFRPKPWPTDRAAAANELDLLKLDSTRLRRLAE
jgi:hypothetical protein